MHFVILKGSPIVQMQLTWLKGSSKLPHLIFFPTVKHPLKYTCIFEAVRGRESVAFCCFFVVAASLANLRQNSKFVGALNVTL